MGLLRRDHAVKYRMREKMIAFGDDYWIEDDQGNKAFRVDGKALRVRDHFSILDADGNQVASIKERKLGRDKMIIELADGRTVKVTKAVVGIRDRFSIDVDGGKDLHAHGNVVDHEYEIAQDGRGGKVAEISKKWFRVRDTYGVEIDEGQDVAMILAITVAIDALAHD
jgi:uncharacterized protein YxjI